MSQAFIVDALRTPVGRRNGALAQIHPADLAAAPLAALFDRLGIDTAEYDEIILGCIDQIGPQAFDIARTAWLAAGGSEAVPGTTIDRQCGSGQQAVHYAAQAVMSGTSDLVVAGGVQNMSTIPIGSANIIMQDQGFPNPFAGSKAWADRYGDQQISQFHGAEMMANRWGITRDQAEAFAAESHRRAIASQEAGFFAEEILPLGGLRDDEGPRTPNRAKMRELQTMRPNGIHTPATASQISDGAALLAIASERAVEEYGLVPRARIHHVSARADDPVMMLSAPIRATRFALERTGMDINEFDAIEINEAFAAVVLAWEKELRPDMSKVNMHGGAIALGHPIGATGARLMTTLLHSLENSGGRFGLQTMCEGGGQANVTIIERLDN
ncbi:MAG TPA: acetyl-CoA C-acetyltransferase [Candidatus Yaniella excrementigallinarum]|nr:acetyl-CoA C-acetyltransferase [Candidatus Yaniella excrementigallinarum]